MGFREELEPFLNKHGMLSITDNDDDKSADVFEETLLRMAGITTKPSACFYNAISNEENVIIRIGGLNSEDVAAFAQFLHISLEEAVTYNANQEHEFVVPNEIMDEIIFPSFQEEIKRCFEAKPQILKPYINPRRALFNVHTLANGLLKDVNYTQPVFFKLVEDLNLAINFLFESDNVFRRIAYRPLQDVYEDFQELILNEPNLDRQNHPKLAEFDIALQTFLIAVTPLNFLENPQPTTRDADGRRIRFNERSMSEQLLELGPEDPMSGEEASDDSDEEESDSLEVQFYTTEIAEFTRQFGILPFVNEEIATAVSVMGLPFGKEMLGTDIAADVFEHMLLRMANITTQVTDCHFYDAPIDENALVMTMKGLKRRDATLFAKFLQIEPKTVIFEDNTHEFHVPYHTFDQELFPKFQQEIRRCLEVNPLALKPYIIPIAALVIFSQAAVGTDYPELGEIIQPAFERALQSNPLISTNASQANAYQSVKDAYEELLELENSPDIVEDQKESLEKLVISLRVFLLMFAPDLILTAEPPAAREVVGERVRLFARPRPRIVESVVSEEELSDDENKSLLAGTRSPMMMSPRKR